MNSQLNVALISTHDNKGGAARAAFRLHLGLREIGCHSTLFCRWRHSDLSSVHGLYDDQPTWKGWLAAAESFRLRWPVTAHRLGKNCDLFSLPTGPCRALPPELRDADIVHLHWTSSMIDLPSFFQSISPQGKVVWTLHDMNLFTGGCHYTGPCMKFVDHCGACPELNSTKTRDLAWRAFEQKLGILDSIPADRLTIVAPSRWLQSAAGQSRLLRRFRVTRIPYGVDTEMYQPQERSAARRFLGVPVDAKVLLFVAGKLSNYRKGVDLLLAAIGKLPWDGSLTDPLLLLAIGEVPQQQFSLPSNVKLLSLGFVNNERQIAAAYASADVFVISSRQDNMPNTILESMACGTPVVGFDVGGIPDLVRDGITGYCAAPEDANSLSQAITRTLANASELRANCREMVVDEYSLATQASRYVALYQELHTNSASVSSNLPSSPIENTDV